MRFQHTLWRAPAILNPRLNGNDCLIDFATVSGIQYDMLRTVDLAGSTWSPVITNLAGNDGTLRVTDTNAGGLARGF